MSDVHTEYPAWITNDPKAVKALKAADRAYDRARAAAVDLPFDQKIEAYRAARCERQAAYNDLMSVAPDMAVGEFVSGGGR
jgi:hypothetical protein